MTLRPAPASVALWGAAGIRAGRMTTRWVGRGLWLVTLAYWAAMFVLTHLPRERLPQRPSVGDKVAHYTSYLVLGCALGVTLWVNNPARRNTLWLVLAAGLAYGAADELLQPLVGRDCELLDWLADAGGVCTAVALLWLARRLMQGATRAATVPVPGEG